MKKHFLLLVTALLLVTTQSISQVWRLGGNNNIGVDGIGTPPDNEFGSNLDTDIILKQNDLERIKLSNGAWTDPVLGLQNATRIGVSINDGVSPLVTSPFSIMHLGEQTNNTLFQRSWFNVGTTYGFNTDFMYVGLKKENSNERTDAVIAWGDNSYGSASGPDVLRFIRLGELIGGSTDKPNTDNGLEVARFSPNQGNLGLGDFSADGLDEEPTRRLDADGTARFRQMPDTLQDVLITGFEEDDIGDYTLTYLAFTGNNGEVLAGDGTWVNNGDCEWNLATNFGSNDLVMGYTGACNEGRVGIGTSTPFLAKAHIFQDQSGIGNPSYGLLSQAEGNTTEIRGVFGTGEATGPNTVTGNRRVVGVEGLAIGDAPNCTYQLIGVYGRTNPIGGSCNNTLAGLFEGDIQVTGMLLPSDETLKENVQTIENASDILGQITPRSYTYKTEEFPGLGLASGTHYGVMAQEIEQILPDAVKNTIGTKTFSEDGMTPEEYVEFTGVYYTEFIPLLIQAHKEQETKINQLQDQVNQLADLINQCCSPDAKSNEQGQGMNEFEMEVTPFKSDLSPNFPNPFERVTQINYSVGCQCEAQIIVFDQLGQQIEVLKSGNTNPGTYNIQWDASNLESGIYFISLLVDGQTFVQQAVKI